MKKVTEEPKNEESRPNTNASSGFISTFKNAMATTLGKVAGCCGCLGLIVVIIIVLAVIGTGSHNSSSSSSSSSNGSSSQSSSETNISSPNPTKQLTWTTTHSYTGSGNKKTEIIHVGNDWKINWSCDPSSFMGGSYNLEVDVNNSDNTSADYGAVNELCQNGNTSGSTEEHQSGDVYLNISSEAAWTINVQELK